MKKTLEERFFDKVNKNGDNGCWSWIAFKDRAGYGRLSSVKNKPPYKAHRVSWFIHNGKIPSGLEICHKCDNPSCVNPDHLFLGTHRENMRDAYLKGRINNYKHGKGENNNSAKFNNNQIRQIRNEYANGALIKELENKYGSTNIIRIVRNIVYYDPSYKPINASARTRPYRKVLNENHLRLIKSSGLSSGRLAKLLNVSKTTILQARKGEY